VGFTQPALLGFTQSKSQCCIKYKTQQGMYYWQLSTDNDAVLCIGPSKVYLERSLYILRYICYFSALRVLTVKYFAFFYRSLLVVDCRPLLCAFLLASRPWLWYMCQSPSLSLFMNIQGFDCANLHIGTLTNCWLVACLVGSHTLKKSVLCEVQDPARYAALEL